MVKLRMCCLGPGRSAVLPYFLTPAELQCHNKRPILIKSGSWLPVVDSYPSSLPEAIFIAQQQQQQHHAKSLSILDSSSNSFIHSETRIKPQLINAHYFIMIISMIWLCCSIIRLHSSERLYRLCRGEHAQGEHIKRHKSKTEDIYYVY